MNQIITNIMIEDHKRIENILMHLNSKIKSKEFRENFNFFKSELEKHMIIEEKSILKTYNPEKYNQDVVKKIISEHKELIKMIKEIEKDQNPESSFLAFSELLIEHKDFENNKLYPKLDKELTKEQKEQIFQKIKKQKEM